MPSTRVVRHDIDRRSPQLTLPSRQNVEVRSGALTNGALDTLGVVSCLYDVVDVEYTRERRPATPCHASEPFVATPTRVGRDQTESDRRTAVELRIRGEEWQATDRANVKAHSFAERTRCETACSDKEAMPA
jgi:hypothetical protein